MASKKKQKQNTKQKPLLLNPVFYIFLTLIVVVTNLRYNGALDKELEVRVLGVSLFVLITGLLALMSNKSRLGTIDTTLLKNPFVLLYGAYVILTGISVFVADNTAEALHELLKLFTFAILFLYLILFVLPKERSRELFLKAAIALSLVVAAIGVVQALNIFTQHGFSVKSAYMITGNYAHKNIFSEIAFIVFALSTYSVYYFRGLWQKAAIAGAVFALLIIIMLVTRAVWVAFFVASVGTFILYRLAVRKQEGKAVFSKPLKYAFAGILLAGVVTVTLFVQLDPNNSIKKHILEATDFTSGNTYHRLNIWKKSIPIVKEHPLMGVGAGNWKIEISKYNVALYYNESGWVVPRRTHNDYINVITETGILGLLLFLAMFGVLIFYLIQLIGRAEMRGDSLFYSALLFILIGYMTFSFFNFTKERVETQILLNTVFAFAVFGYSRLRAKEKPHYVNHKSVRLVGAILLIPVAITAYSAQQRMHTESVLNKVYALASKKGEREINYSYQIVKELNSPFVSLTPMNDPIPSMQAITMLRKQMNKNQVIAKYKEALEVFPYHARTLNELAYVFLLQNKIDSALHYNGLAVKYAPDNLKVYLDQVVYLKKADRDDEAFELLANFTRFKWDKRYKKMLHAFLKQRVVDLLKNEKNRLIVQEAVKYGGSQSNLLSIFYSSQKKKNITFEKLFLISLSRHIKKTNPQKWSQVNKDVFKKYGVKV
ncbi:MAG: O-antigen ligase family protein [Salinivirgaceae bacterium]|jgi:O-antigen ligase|nr:O-antigen ligase family protein [Salinivirgaceae bacterium]